ncbi:COG4 transport protein-domain-containing protein [Gongronella butleri]|nr:COG4 transport protein-domain-containing protein [Gongronella butleri]
MLRVIQQLQQESDTQSGAVLDRFFESRNIEAKLSEIQSLNVTMVRNHRHLNSSSASSTNAGFASPTLAAATLSSASPSGSPNPNANAATASAAATIASTANHPLVGPRQLDANLLEMSLVCQRASLFQGFLHDRADEEMDKLQASKNESAKDDLPDGADFANKDQRYYSKNSLLLSSGLSKRLIELTNAFLVIDDYLLRTSMDKAIALDDYDASSSQTSTCVDDVFYILKKVIKRSMATYQPDLVASTVQATLKALDNGYLQVFQQRLGSAFTSQDVASRSDRSMEQSKVNYMVTLNNLDASSEYTHRLTDEMKKEATKAMWQNEDDDRRAVMDSLDKFEAVATKFDQLLHTGMEQLLGQILKPRLRPLFQEAYRDVKYVLEEEEYNEAELDELFVKRFQHGFDGMVQLYRKTLTPSNWSSLMGILLDVMTTQWERIVMQTRFNQYGALRFDKDLRAIIQHLSNMTEWFSRDKFTRLNQMATVLCFEEPSEIYHYWGAKAGLSSWRLTVTEVKKILSLRLDFDADQVNNLSL